MKFFFSEKGSKGMKISEFLHVDNVEKIHVCGIAKLHEAIFGKPFPDESYEKKFKEHNIYVFGYFEDEVLVGYTLVVDQQQDENLYAWYGGILPQYQAHGITAQMLDILVEKAKEFGYKSISLATTNCRPNMLRLAIKFGFDIVDIKKRDYGEGNKIYFKYYIKPESQLEIDFSDDRYNCPAYLESVLIGALKNNCVLIRFIDVKDENIQAVHYVMNYCKKFIHVPKFEVKCINFSN